MKKIELLREIEVLCDVQLSNIKGGFEHDQDYPIEPESNEDNGN